MVLYMFIGNKWKVDTEVWSNSSLHGKLWAVIT